MTASNPAAAAKKMILYRKGVTTCEAFLAHNGIVPPRYEIDNTIRGCGLYVPKEARVLVALTACRLPPKAPTGFSWSFPGYKADRTPYGVVAHETGHHVHARRLANIDMSEWENEDPVTSYEPNRAERLAEALKLMITNPDMLRRGRPIRYRTLIRNGIGPATTATWQEVLETFDAPERWIAAARNWIEAGERKAR